MASPIAKLAHLQIPLEDALNATNNFHQDNIIGHGGLGTAYKGQLLRSGNLIKIAALRVDRKQGEGDVEFWTEISMLSDLNHPNLVSIIGFCDEKGEKVIITTYESKGSLEKHVNNPNLTWTQRLKICIGIARALSYLHNAEGRSYGVIHRNINSSTILLDENYETKLSGFKISIKQASNRMDQVFLCDPIGTIGYMDPEIEKTKGVTHKSDIYSFGVVLFELLCGRRAYVKNEANRLLVPLAKYHFENKTLEDIIHPDLWNHMSPQSLVRFSKVAYSCLKEERSHRPDLNYIVAELEKALEFQLRRENLIYSMEKNSKYFKIPLSTIKLVTDNFSEPYLIGGTSLCTLYRAEVNYSNKEDTLGAVMKRMLHEDDEVVEKAFCREIEVLTSIDHRNIVTLLGFCVEGPEMILIVESCFSNGSLANYLTESPTWEKRLEICIDVAHALNYLHFEMEDQKIIIARNISSYNIGVDENMGAKLCDFGLSVLLATNQLEKTLDLDTIFGLEGYMDPEYKSGKLKRESDVYSFGVVLFEVLFGRTADDPIYLKESEEGLARLARNSFRMGTLEEMTDPTIKNETHHENSSVQNRGPNKDSLQTFFKIAYQCVAETQEQRPTMTVVVKELEKALFFQEEQVQHPQHPAAEQVVNELEKQLELLELQLTTHEDIPEERIQSPNTDQVVAKLEESLELQNEISFKNLEHLKIRLGDIKLATDNFSKTYKIATNGYYTFYRAELDYFDTENLSSVSIEGKNKNEHPKRHSTVIIKHILPIDYEKGKKDFYTEIEILTRFKHPNIVTLLGFCVEGSEMVLVIENVSNAYLDYYLGDISYNERRILTWERRLKICIDVAQAMNYLHQNNIINRDINSYSIGLDENWGAKIVEFGSSVFLPPNLKGQALHLKWRGRRSYIDPEYKMTYKLNKASDVYSFGVVLFEILCGRRANDPIYKESDKGLADVARQSFSMGTLEYMIDPILKEETSENNFLLNRGPNKDSLHVFTDIAYYCAAETQDKRPPMNIVVQQLEKALFHQKNNKNNPRIPLKDIKLATQNFHRDNCIGGGGFGRVYKGNLQYGDGYKTIVAKRLDTRLGQGEQQFLSELQILLEYKHENVIRIGGYCDEKDEKIIVYEYASRGSLDRYLSDASLTWVKRLNICIDVASALDFFHGGDGKQAKVIHRDIKTANILLNHDWKAKLADFGLSLISPLIQDTDYVIDHACGTPGYLDPLYRKSGFLTIESDIYSFGVVLFEILCGRSTFAIMKHEGRYLPDFIKNNFEEGKHDEVVFEQIREQIVPKSLTTFQEIAYQCLHHEREKRPTTNKVLAQLKKAMEFQNMASTITKFAHLQISLEDVLKATNNFHDDNIIGKRGFGTAYKGRILLSGRLMKIVARRFDCKHREADLEFLMEISILLSNLKHTNLVSIIGFCDEQDEKIIVTMYEANGSLLQHLNSPNLTWTQRLRICVGVARALSYLHYDEGRDYAVLHCNISSDIILLDENWEVKLSGFENSIKQLVCYKDQVCLYEHTGTIGYIDPSIGKTGGVTQKSDIYSFGVVLFEILCGREAFMHNEDNTCLASLVKHHHKNKTISDLIHPGLYWLNQISPQSFHVYLNVAYSCINEDRVQRPYMGYIVHELEKALEHQLRYENVGKKLEHLKIPLSDIKLATDDFSETHIISSTNVHTSYRAELDHFDKDTQSSVEGKNKGDFSKHSKRHNTVVIKRISSSHKWYTDEEFFTEIEILASVKHPNIVTLLGYCFEVPEMILVTENVSNGYLDQYLRHVNKMRVLTWEKRLKICVDVAHALNYLHSQMGDQKVIIHRGIRSSNIGLDENLVAKIVDFCFSVILPPNQEDEALYPKLIGTLYYTDPEYENTGKLKRESDVYSFGVILFELLCGRLANDPIFLKESDEGLAHVARQRFYTGTLEDMIDLIIKEEPSENNFVQNKGPNKNSLHTFIEIAHQCVAKTQDQRPTMKVVLKELEKALLFQVGGSASKNKK